MPPRRRRELKFTRENKEDEMNEGKIEIGVNQGAVAQGANAVAVCESEKQDFRPGDTV